MSKRSERLLDLVQALRRRRLPVTGQVLAEETGVSIRTLYRDVDTLKSLGAAIEGEGGIGFVLKDDYWLPPLMFSAEEVEALVLGLRMLVYGPDAELSRHADDARAKISAMLPEDRRVDMEAVGLFAVPRADAESDSRLPIVRRAIRDETELQIDYRDGAGADTERVIWPVSLGYLGPRQMLVAWCTLREDFRRFWIDRIIEVNATETRYARPRRTLLHEWREQEDMPDIS